MLSQPNITLHSTLLQERRSGVFLNGYDETTLVYQGGFEQWKREWVERIQTKAAKVNTENVMNFCGEVFQLETELQNPLDTDAQFDIPFCHNS